MKEFKASLQSIFDEFKTLILEIVMEKESRMAEYSVAQAATEALEEEAPEEEASATQMQINAAVTVGATKGIMAEQPGAAAQLVAAILQPGITITEAQIEELPTTSDPSAATQPEAAPVVALGTVEVTLDVPRYGAVEATRPWLLNRSLGATRSWWPACRRGVVLWPLACCLPMRFREGVG